MITAVCVSIDPLEGILTYSCAGHPPPILRDCDAGEVARLDQAGAPPLGVAEPADMIEERLMLPDNARLAMYTDGLVERRSKSIDEGIDVLARTLSSSSTVTAREMMSAVTEAIGAPTDDVALLLASIEPAMSFEIELPAVPDMLRALRRRLTAWLTRIGFDDEAAGEIVLAVSEACNNAVEHAYNGGGPGAVWLTASFRDELLSIEIADRGRWLVAEPTDERGRGIHLMNGLMDRVDIKAGADGTRITLERRRAAAPIDGAAPLAS
jgi:anti-sigma regulatory factor (Ser/Thr protein kinase)